MIAYAAILAAFVVVMLALGAYAWFSLEADPAVLKERDDLADEWRRNPYMRAWQEADRAPGDLGGQR